VVISKNAYWLLLAAIVAERGVEVALSRRNAWRTLSRGGIEAGWSHYPPMVIVHVLFLLSCGVENLLHDSGFPAAVKALALAGAIAAQALRYWAVVTLGDRWNTRVIVVPTEPPVTGGPFRYVRHPNYLAVAIEIACLPLVRGLWITALVFSIANAALLSVRIRVEERALGASYPDTFASRARFLPLARSRTQS
jgi:methyltransferase